ncbi:hypothetical protein [Sphingobacterium bambusae]|uniref:Uncharacterized protein n=2 Tax=Sphingobacterium bambusae TaxID=662858 RepID=A0ABW6BE46_9SPHI
MLGGNSSNGLTGVVVDNADGTLTYSYDGDSSKINLHGNGGLGSVGAFTGGSPDMFSTSSTGDSGFPIHPYPGLSGYGYSGGYNGPGFGNSGGNSGGTYYPIYGGGYYGAGYNGNGWGISGSGGNGGGGVGYSGGNWGVSGSGGNGGYGGGISYSF